MTRNLIVVVLLLCLCGASPVYAGEWTHTFRNFAVGGTNNYFGSATISTDQSGNSYVSFAASGSPAPSATVEFSMPDYFTAPTMTCLVHFRINSTDIATDVTFEARAVVSTIGTLWQTNDAAGTYTVGNSVTPSATAKATLEAIIMNIPINNLATGNQCASVSACKNLPGRIRLLRSNTNGIPDPQPAEVIDMTCYATTS